MLNGNDKTARRLDMVMGVLLILLAASLLFPAVRSLSSVDDLHAGESAATPIADLRDLAEDDTLAFHLRGERYLLIHQAGDVRLVSGTCPNCVSQVEYHPDQKLLRCGTGSCSFDVRGHVLEGLSAEPLDHFQVLVTGDLVYLARSGD